MAKVKAYGAQNPGSALSGLEIERRSLNPDDVQIEILYCGVCHSDLHTARNEWKNTIYPSVPGQNIGPNVFPALLAVLLAPVIPKATGKLWAALAGGSLGDLVDQSLIEAGTWGQLPAGSQIGELEPLFPRVEQDEK